MNFEFIDVTADTSAIFPRLKINLEVSNDEEENYTFFNFSGKVSDANTNKIFGNLTPESFNTSLNRNRKASFSMNLDIDVHKINVIEEIRKGKDLWIMVFVTTVFCRKHTDRQFSPSDVNTNGFWVTHKAHGDKIKIPKSEWVKILEDLNYCKYRIIEIPLPRLPEGTTLDKAIEHLGQAQQKFNSGEYDDVLIDCRDALEEIHFVIKSIEKMDKLLREKFTNILGSEKEKRINDFKNSFKLYTDLGGHKVIPEVKDIDRSDAELAMNCAYDLVYYYAKRLEKANKTE